MKSYLFLLTFLVSFIGLAQENHNLSSFETLNSQASITIKVVKSKKHKILLKGDKKNLAKINWNVKGKVLYINSNGMDMGKTPINITVYTPTLKQVNLGSSGKLTMENFNRIDDFTAFVKDHGIMDLSNVKFKHLTADARGSGVILYKSTHTLVSNSKGGGQVKSTGSSRLL